MGTAERSNAGIRETFFDFDGIVILPGYEYNRLTNFSTYRGSAFLPNIILLSRIIIFSTTITIGSVEDIRDEKVFYFQIYFENYGFALRHRRTNLILTGNKFSFEVVEWLIGTLLRPSENKQ